MKKILITTDFSAHSRHTVDYIINLFHDTQIPCNILLLNTFKVLQPDPKKVIATNDELKKLSTLGLEVERSEALRKITNPLIKVDIASHMGSLNNVVLQILQNEKVDLVGMGKKKGRHVEMMSSLLKKYNCPLLITYMEEHLT